MVVACGGDAEPEGGSDGLVAAWAESSGIESRWSVVTSPSCGLLTSDRNSTCLSTVNALLGAQQCPIGQFWSFETRRCERLVLDDDSPIRDAISDADPGLLLDAAEIALDQAESALEAVLRRSDAADGDVDAAFASYIRRTSDPALLAFPEGMDIRERSFLAVNDLLDTIDTRPARALRAACIPKRVGRFFFTCR